MAHKRTFYTHTQALPVLSAAGQVLEHLPKQDTGLPSFEPLPQRFRIVTVPPVSFSRSLQAQRPFWGRCSFRRACGSDHFALLGIVMNHHPVAWPRSAERRWPGREVHASAWSEVRPHPTSCPLCELACFNPGTKLGRTAARSPKLPLVRGELNVRCPLGPYQWPPTFHRPHLKTPGTRARVPAVCSALRRSQPSLCRLRKIFRDIGRCSLARAGSRPQD